MQDQALSNADARRAGEPADVPTDGPGATEEPFVGVVTRATSWIIDAALINVAAIMVGVGTALVLSLFPLSKDLKPPLEVVAGFAYVIWCAAYFVVFWSVTGQTPGARIMQIRLVSAERARVKPARAIVRWVGMNLAMLPLFAGYLPILWERRGFPDWLAHTLVVDAPELSLVERRMAARRATRDRTPRTRSGTRA